MVFPDTSSGPLAVVSATMTSDLITSVADRHCSVRAFILRGGLAALHESVERDKPSQGSYSAGGSPSEVRAKAEAPKHRVRQAA